MTIICLQHFSASLHDLFIIFAVKMQITGSKCDGNQGNDQLCATMELRTS